MYLDFESVLLATDSPDSSVGVEEPLSTVQETSAKRLVVGPLDVRLHSSAVHRILKMVSCAMDHEYEPYCKPHQGQTSETTWTTHISVVMKIRRLILRLMTKFSCLLGSSNNIYNTSTQRDRSAKWCVR